jgi:hypothetical protein
VGRDGEQVATARQRFDLWAEEPDIDPAEVPRTDDLRAIADAAAVVATAQDRLNAAVDAARAQDRSWRQIGLALGMSRQAARERYGQEPTAKRKISRARRVMRQEAAVLDRLALNQSKAGEMKRVSDGVEVDPGPTKKARRPH